MKPSYYFYLLLLFVLIIPATNANAQNKDKKGEFCQNNWSWGNKSSFNEKREMTIAKTNQLKVDGKRNGGISVRGEDRNDILIRACVVAWAESESEARELAQKIKIQTSPIVQVEMPIDENNWSVTYEILVPKKTDLSLNAHNGGISITNVEGNLNFETRNGGVSLKEIGGEVRGKTKNGGVTVKLSGNSFKGTGLDVETVNGGVQLLMPENYSAKIETETVNGGFHSDFDALQVESKRSWGRRSISKDLNGGGATVRVATTNGGVSIKSQR